MTRWKFVSSTVDALEVMSCQMAAIGFRCHKDALAYVVADGTPNAPILLEHRYVRMPADDRPGQLVWARMEVQEILQRVAPVSVTFKAAEPISRTKDLGRAEVEGILQEAVRSFGLNPLRRIKSQIRSDLGFTRTARYLNEALLGDLADLPANQRDAGLAALAALANA